MRWEYETMATLKNSGLLVSDDTNWSSGRLKNLQRIIILRTSRRDGRSEELFGIILKNTSLLE